MDAQVFITFSVGKPKDRRFDRLQMVVTNRVDLIVAAQDRTWLVSRLVPEQLNANQRFELNGPCLRWEKQQRENSYGTTRRVACDRGRPDAN